ncbi:MAG: putative taurine catabolism dioxygenase [Phycisphaerales bacterium]|nr:putative taurine catabolism dioxygenase [Phycisphaerales bacterium]MDB5358326.1 putative taurine catabolism dioxygenase [Phycisphaerales bacterium]
MNSVRVVPVEVPGQQVHYGQPFPLMLECQTPGAPLELAATWLGEHRHELLAKAAEHGAVLFRGFPVATPEDFDRFIAAFDLPNFPYDQSLSNAVRVNKTPRVFTANEAPPNVTIFLHHEMAQTPVHPSRLFFFCEQAAAIGGATPVCRSDVLWGRLAMRCPEFARDCESKGLKYSNVMPAEADAASGMGRSWQSTLRAETREQAQSKLKGLGYSWEWQADGSLRATTPVLPAVRKMANGRTSFFNQLIAAANGWKDSRNDPSKAITFGDGSPLDRDAVLIATQLGEELSFDIPWRNGDVALIDNYVAMHGRRTFSGTRRVLASLIASES